jgi:hypothetical protein
MWILWVNPWATWCLYSLHMWTCGLAGQQGIEGQEVIQCIWAGHIGHRSQLVCRVWFVIVGCTKGQIGEGIHAQLTGSHMPISEPLETPSTSNVTG